MGKSRGGKTRVAAESRSKGKQVQNLPPDVVNLCSDDDDPSYPTPDRTMVADESEDSDDEGAPVSAVKTRSKRAKEKPEDTTAGGKRIYPNVKPTPKPAQKRKKRKADDDFIDDDEVDEVSNKKGTQKPKPAKRKKGKKAGDGDEDEEQDKGDADKENEDPLAGYGQRKHVLEWVHMSSRYTLYDQTKLKLASTMEFEAKRALRNAERKLEKDKLVVSNKQIELCALEVRRLELMSPEGRNIEANTSLEKQKKEVEQLKLRAATKDTELIEAKRALAEVNTKLEKETGIRMAMEAKLIEAGLKGVEDAYMAG